MANYCARRFFSCVLPTPTRCAFLSNESIKIVNIRSFIASLIGISITLAGCGGSDPVDRVSIDFMEPRQGYVIERSGDVFFVIGKRSGETYQARGHQAFRFADASVNLRVGESAASIPAADLRRLILLYTAYFNRVPDADGLVYWIDQFKAGLKIDHIADRFEAEARRDSAATGMSDTMSNAEFVRVVTRNIFGEGVTPEAAQLAIPNLENGISTRAQVVRILLNVAESYKGDPMFNDVSRLLDNKFAVGFQLAVQQGLTFAGTDGAIKKGMQISAAVTPSSTAEAIELAGATQAGFSLYTPAPRRASDPITLDSLRACHAALKDDSPDFYQCLIGHAIGKTTSGDTSCTLTVHEDGRFVVSTPAGTQTVSPPYGEISYSKMDHGEEGFSTVTAAMRRAPEGELLFGMGFISPALASVLSLEAGISVTSDAFRCRFDV